MTKPKGQNTINYVPDYPSTPSSNSPSNTPQPAAPRQSPTPRTPTKKRKLPQLTQHATMTPPTATSTPETPEPTILRKNENITLTLLHHPRLLLVLPPHQLISPSHSLDPTLISNHHNLQPLAYQQKSESSPDFPNMPQQHTFCDKYSGSQYPEEKTKIQR